MPHKEMLDVTMPLYDTKSHKILEIELCTVFLRSDAVATILFIIVWLLFKDGVYFVGKPADRNELSLGRSCLHFYPLFYSLFNAPIILKYTNWISLICT